MTGKKRTMECRVWAILDDELPESELEELENDFKKMMDEITQDIYDAHFPAVKECYHEPLGREYITEVEE